MTDYNTEQGDERARASLVQTLTLISSASTATRVMRAVVDRRKGVDPSEQEVPDQATTGLRASLDELQALLVPVLVASAVVDAEELEERPRLIRHFDELQRLAEVVILMHRVHQRLLSVYPQVADDVVEEARALHKEAVEAADQFGDCEEAIRPLLVRILDFTLDLERFLQLS